MKKKVYFQRIAYLQERNTIRNHGRMIQAWLDRYNEIENLPDITSQTFKEWAKDPKAYYERQIEKLKKKYSNGLSTNDKVFKDLFNLHFERPQQFPFYINTFTDFFNLNKGEVILDNEKIEQHKEAFTQYTDDPVLIEKLEAIENLIKAYNDLCDRFNVPIENRNQFKELFWDAAEKQFDAKALNI